MSRMGEMSTVIEDLRKCAVLLNETAAWLIEVFSSGDTETQEEKAEVPEPTLEAVRAVLAEKSRQGHTAQIRSLLQKYGAVKLSEINPASYSALLADAEVLE